MKQRLQTMIILAIMLSISSIAYSQNNKLVIYKSGGTMNTVLLEDIDRMEFIFSIEQSIPLATGWNMISSYIQPQLPDSMNNVLDEVAGNMLIAKDIAGAVYIPQYDINTIGKWDVTQGYQLYMSNADTLKITGTEVVPSETPIQLSAGWNTIGYLRNSEMNAENAFVSITDNNNLLIAKTLDGKVYIPSYGINTIGNMKTGVGYKVYVTTSDSLVYPGN